MALDVSIFQKTPGGAVVQSLFLPGTGGAAASGEAKLGQRFVDELMTSKGSLVYEPARGTSFVAQLKAGVQTTWDVQSAFALAMLDVTINLRAEETESDPPAERFGGASLTAVVLGVDSVSLNVNVTSLAGTTTNVLLPLTLLV